VTTVSSLSTAPPSTGLDPRGLRFAAALTSVVLAAALLWTSPVLLALQATVFAVGALAGPARQPYGLLFRGLVRPRIGPPTHREDPAGPRFAQACGLAFCVVGLVGFAIGATWLALAATAAALAAAFLNAAFDFCLGCEIHLRLVRLRHR